LTRESRSRAKHQQEQRRTATKTSAEAEDSKRICMQEEKATQKLLGRMRAAVATEASFEEPDPGRQVWCEKEAVAHSLYSRRLQVRQHCAPLHCAHYRYKRFRPVPGSISKKRN
jgi:hypothetical protein